MEIWQLARLLVRDIYLLSGDGKLARDFGIKDQLQRAALSVMNNIAEGFDRKSNKEFVHFLYISKGSCAEVRSMLYVAMDLGYISNDQHKNLHDQTEVISKSLSAFIKYLTNTS